MTGSSCLSLPWTSPPGSKTGEQGLLLGIALAPDGEYVYLSYTSISGDTRIVEYAMATDGTFKASSRRVLLRVDQPYSNHNGGQLAFGPLIAP